MMVMHLLEKDPPDLLASPAANPLSPGVDRPPAHCASDVFGQLTQVIRREVANGYTVGHN